MPSKSKNIAAEETAVANKNIRQGDKVIVLAGNYRGKVGAVLKRMGDRIVVQGVNVRKKHTKNPQEKGKGQIVEIERSIHASNVSLCIGENTPVKLRVRKESDQTRTLYYKSGDREEVYRPVTNPK